MSIKSYNKNPVVLVTGANGFLGKNLLRELLSQQKKIIAVCNNLDPEFSTDQNVEWIRPEGRTPLELENELRDKCISCIYHLAWSGTSGENRANYNVQIENIRMACDYVILTSRIGCKRFIYASSINEIETYEYLQLNDVQPGGGYIYGTAKLAAHLMAEVVAKQNNIDFIPCLITNIFGVGEKSARLINDSVRKLYNGEHCAFSSGNQTYDFIYITDAVASIVAVGDKGKGFTQYYIGSGNPKPLKEFLLEMRDIVSPNTEIGLGELPFNGKDIDYSQFNCKQVEEDTGYINKISFKFGINLLLESIQHEK